jgi:tetratricopeptide (TPR) repeat protein
MNIIFKPIDRISSSFPAILCLLVFLTITGQNAYSQKQVGVVGKANVETDTKPPLTLSNIIKILNTEKIVKQEVEIILTPAERNNIVLSGIRSRGGVAFVMTAAVEERLRTAGATDALIAAIRQSAAKLQGDEFKINKIARRYLDLGDRAMAGRKFEEAIDNYNQVIELDPTIGAAFNQRGIVYKMQGLNFTALGDTAQKEKNAEEVVKNYAEANKNYEKAIEDFTKAISLDPTGRSAYNNRGACYYEKPTNNNVEETKANARKAVEDFTKAIEIDARFKEAYLNRSKAYRYKLGDATKADADEAKIKEINNSATEIKSGVTAQPVATDAKP